MAGRKGVGPALATDWLRLESGAKVARARDVQRIAAGMPYAARMKEAAEWRALAHELIHAAGIMERERPDPLWIPEYLRKNRDRSKDRPTRTL